MALVSALERLRESRPRCGEVFSRVRALICELSADGTTLFVNDGVIGITGYRPEELIGKNWWDIFLSGEQRRQLEILNQRLRTGDVNDFHLTLVARDGSLKTLVWSSLHTCLADGSPPTIVSFALDATDLKRDETALRDSERRYRDLLNLLPEVVFEADETGRLTFANRSAFVSFGYANEKLEDVPPILDCVVPHERQRAAQNIRRVLNGEDLGSQEYEFMRRDSTTFPVMVHSRPILKSGRIVGLRGIIVDITERKRIEEGRNRRLVREQALARIGRALVSETELERVAEVVIQQSSQILVVEAAGLWLANPACRELRALAHRNLRAPAVSGRISYDAPFVTAWAAKTERIQSIDDVLACPDSPGEDRVWAARAGMRGVLAVPLLNRGRLVGVLTCLSSLPRHFVSEELEFIATVADLFAVAIENARLQQHLRSRERQVSLLLRATIDAQEEERRRVCLEVHQGVAQALAPAHHHLQALDEHPELPGILHDRVHSAAALVQDAIRETRAVISSLSPSGLGSMGLVETLRGELAEIQSRSGLQIALDADVLRFHTDVETSLYRIVREAVNNVVKHAIAGKVVVRMKKLKGVLEVSVQDDGVGFDLVALERQSYPRGVGLVGMRKRAELLGGSFTIKSLPQEGTLVRIEVPLPAVEGEESGVIEGIPPSLETKIADGWLGGNRITVLIVDDHAVTRRGLRAMLETEESVEVVGEASDGVEALRLVAELRPRVVLMDIRMPTLDGLETTRQLKASYPTTAVIVMTNYDHEALVVGAVQAGAGGYLLKDASRELLSYTVGAVASGGISIKASLLRRAIDSLAEAAQPVESTPALLPGGEDLTDRERAVLKLLAEGCTNKEIGNNLGLAEITVKKHVQSIIGKLRASDRTQAAIMALRMGLIR